MNNLENLYQCMVAEYPEIQIDKYIAERALIPIEKMLEISKMAGLI